MFTDKEMKEFIKQDRIDIQRAFDSISDDDDLKDKCFCDYCDSFVPTSECETIKTSEHWNAFEILCNKCYNKLNKESK